MEAAMSWMMQAVRQDGTLELPTAAVAAFDALAGAAATVGSPPTSVRIGGVAFCKLTGFHTAPQERLSRRDVKRAADAASPERAKALGNCYGDVDYTAAADFLRICARHDLAIQAVR
jgi:TPR repeat protein